MQKIIIEQIKHNGNIIIKRDYCDDNRQIYIGHSLRNAIALYRKSNGLQFKRLNIIRI